jgi:hypothetical protein
MSDLVRATFVLRRAASIGLIHQPTLPENMETLPSTNHFDAISGTWDCDPVKRARALAIAEGTTVSIVMRSVPWPKPSVSGKFAMSGNTPFS